MEVREPKHPGPGTRPSNLQHFRQNQYIEPLDVVNGTPTLGAQAHPPDACLQKRMLLWS